MGNILLFSSKAGIKNPTQNPETAAAFMSKYERMSFLVKDNRIESSKIKGISKVTIGEISS
jgi:hypothetical protein